jgi:putative sigma-54 modulation protein
MNIERLKATGLEMTEAIRSAVETELARLDPLLARWGEATTAHVEVGKSTAHHHKGPFFRAEINLEIPGKLLRAEEEGEDLYVALKEAARTLERELVKEKELRG